ncbi:hypothetical protein PPOLYM_01661 [Paenibacillus polymyxa]|nr:hypothetical protein PPOLYM_01661 [Paenibacillus polymyxa]
MLKKMVLLIIAASFLFIVTVPVQSHSHIQLHDQVGGF